MDEILNGTGPGVLTSSLPLDDKTRQDTRCACVCCYSFCGWLDLCSEVKGACFLVPNQLLLCHVPSKTPVYLSTWCAQWVGLK